MSRIEFMSELRALLADLSEEERDEALQYYNDYFDDAGAENETSIIKELGSPQKLAATIKAGLFGQNEEESEYRETGYTDTRFEEKRRRQADKMLLTVIITMADSQRQEAIRL